MPNNEANPGNGAPSQGNGTPKEELQKPKADVPPEFQTLVTRGLAAAEAEAQVEHAKWKSKKALDDLIGEDTDKWTKRFCVAEVAAYHISVKFAEGKPNAEAIKALARSTALRGLGQLLPNLPREKLAQLVQYKPEELEDP
jgi:hypothetical protein